MLAIYIFMFPGDSRVLRDGYCELVGFFCFQYTEPVGCKSESSALVSVAFGAGPES